MSGQERVWPGEAGILRSALALSRALHRTEKLTFTRALEQAKLDPRHDLRFGDWSSISMDEEDLRGFDFTGANLRGCTFRNALIAGAKFDEAVLEPATLMRARDYEASADARALRAAIRTSPAPRRNNSGQVFIAYKREDRERVELLSEALIDCDLQVWFDAGIEVGAEWEQRIISELRAAGAVLVCWSFGAVASQWVLREAKIGLDRNILVPVMVQPCALTPPFDSVQHADLTNWDGEPDHPEFQKVLMRLEHVLGRKHLMRNARMRGGGRRAEIVGLLRAILVERARKGAEPLTYKEAEEALRAAAAEEDLRIGEFDQHTLWGALEAISEQCRRRRDPPLEVMVVSSESRMPGRSFWQKNVFLEGAGSALERDLFAHYLQRVREWSWSQDI